MTTITKPGTTQRDTVAEAVVTATNAIHEKAKEAVAGIRGDLAADATALLTGVQSLAQKAQNAAEEAAAHRANLDLHPDGRQARAAERIAQAEAELTQAADQLAARRDVLVAQLTHKALHVEAKPDAQALTRQDALMVLSMSDDKANALRSLASDPDPAIRGLVAGQWGERYARAAGVRDVPNLMTLVRHDALATAAAGHGPTAEAARAAMTVGSMPVEVAANNARNLLR